MTDKFEAQVNAFADKTKEKMLAVVKNSLQDLVEEVQTPVSKGGKMRVKTGFLRSSGVAELNVVPRGPGRGDRNGFYTWAGDSILLVLAKMKLGDTFVFGWTANYAKYREAFDGFLISGLQNWQNIVNNNIKKVKDK